MAVKRGDPRGRQSYKKARIAVLYRDNFTCAYCHREANQVDHIRPVANDSSIANAIDMDNMVACCADCNRRKSAKPLSVFLASTATPPVSLLPISPQKMTETVHIGPMTRGISS